MSAYTENIKIDNKTWKHVPLNEYGVMLITHNSTEKIYFAISDSEPTYETAHILSPLDSLENVDVDIWLKAHQSSGCSASVTRYKG